MADIQLEVAPAVIEIELDPGALATSAAAAAIASSRYTHVQGTAATFWTITHNLNRFPAVTVVDSGGNVGWGAVQYVDANTLTIAFSAAFAGKAYLN